MSDLEQQKMEEEAKLLANITAKQDELDDLLEQWSGKWGYEDPVYRFYHQSLKVYNVQAGTQEITAKLQSLAPSRPLNAWFLDIVRQGTGQVFELEDNKNWLAITRPIVEAFFHARFFLEMVCKYGRELESPPTAIPSDWAAVLHLYNLR